MEESLIPGCSSSVCAIKTPKGQMTNGPCMCKPIMLRARIYELEKERKEAEDKIQGLYEDAAGEDI
ncbi:MAG: hypothetical protein KAS32_07420 [Candidatus Peribacteraceae bacterium]|nr:hypothetical protein [Candidatus Peribacteraceae bacterium]